MKIKVKMNLTIETAGGVLIAFREKHGLTLENLSKKTDVSVPTIIAIEKGHSKPHVTTIFKLNQYLSKFEKPCTEDM